MQVTVTLLYSPSGEIRKSDCHLKNFTGEKNGNETRSIGNNPCTGICQQIAWRSGTRKRITGAGACSRQCRVWDWGGEDWETGLGAAAHMGRKDIANTLLENGARLDLFAAAMLGKLDIVKAALDAYPDANSTPGPHGIPLIAHAKAGGEEAKAVLDFLESSKR